jgi:hypothetical protein
MTLGGKTQAELVEKTKTEVHGVEGFVEQGLKKME